MERIHLQNTGILLVVRLDSVERLENALEVARYLSVNFNANIYLWEITNYCNGILENMLPARVMYTFIKDYDPILHRTRYINDMIRATSEQYVAVWDIDVIVPVEQVVASVDFLCNGADFSYPYEYYFYDTSMEIRRMYLESKDIKILLDYRKFMNRMYAPYPVGGVFFANRDSYIKCGMENESFYGWGVEDGERFSRWRNHGMCVRRVQGPIFHLSHPRGINSRPLSGDDVLVKQRIHRLNSLSC